jgi:hypothetical protein
VAERKHPDDIEHWEAMAADVIGISSSDQTLENRIACAMRSAYRDGEAATAARDIERLQRIVNAIDVALSEAQDVRDGK